MRPILTLTVNESQSTYFSVRIEVKVCDILLRISCDKYEVPKRQTGPGGPFKLVLGRHVEVALAE